MLIDKGELWNSVAVHCHYDPEHPLDAYGKVISEIAKAPVEDAISIRWIEQYLDRKRTRFEDVRRLGGDAEYLLRKIDAIEELLEDFRRD